MVLEEITSAPWFRDVIVTIITLIGAFLIIKWTAHFLNKSKEKWDIDVTLIQVLNEIVKYSIITLAIIIILNELGFNITAIALSLGIVGIAVGFGARDTISNFISGIFILADKSLKVGDIIGISNQKGRVVQLGFRTTTLLTYDERIIKVPNSLFSSNPYINYTVSDTRRVELKITIPHDLELEETIKALEDMVISRKDVLKTPKPKIVVKEISDVGIRTILCMWINNPWEVINSRSKIAREVNKVLNDLKSKSSV